MHHNNSLYYPWRTCSKQSSAVSDDFCSGIPAFLVGEAHLVKQGELRVPLVLFCLGRLRSNIHESITQLVVAFAFIVLSRVQRGNSVLPSHLMTATQPKSVNHFSKYKPDGPTVRVGCEAQSSTTRWAWDCSFSVVKILYSWKYSYFQGHLLPSEYTYRSISEYMRQVTVPGSNTRASGRISFLWGPADAKMPHISLELRVPQSPRRCLPLAQVPTRRSQDKNLEDWGGQQPCRWHTQAWRPKAMVVESHCGLATLCYRLTQRPGSLLHSNTDFVVFLSVFD